MARDETGRYSEEEIHLVLERLRIQYKLNQSFVFRGRQIPVSFFLPQLDIAVQRLSATGSSKVALTSLENEARNAELEFRRIKEYREHLWVVVVIASELNPASLQSYVKPILKHADHVSLNAVEFEHYLKGLVGWTPEDNSPRVRLVLNGETIFVHAKVDSHQSFVDGISKIRDTLTGKALSVDTPEFVSLIGSMYYLLGWIVGDAGKTFTSERLLSARLTVELTRNHPENIPLGEYVGECVKSLGVPWVRRPDGKPTTTSPYGSYWWQSFHSPTFGWFHTACLGLDWRERTTRTAVKMEWLLKAPEEFRIWFLRGLADSDGTVNFRNKSVDIISEPNGPLVSALYRSLGIRSNSSVSKGCSTVAIPGKDAERISIFNPHVLTHRRKFLEKMMGAGAYPRHWPQWLQTRVEYLLKQGLGIPETCKRLLDEDNVYVKYNTLKRKRAKIIGKATGEI